MFQTTPHLNQINIVDELMYPNKDCISVNKQKMYFVQNSLSLWLPCHLCEQSSIRQQINMDQNNYNNLRHHFFKYSKIITKYNTKKTNDY